MRLVWTECQEKMGAETKKDTETLGNKALIVRKTELLQVFFERYDWRLPIELTPSDLTFGLIARSRKRKSAEFTPLSRVDSVTENKDAGTDRIRIKGASGDLLFGPPPPGDGAQKPRFQSILRIVQFRSPSTNVWVCTRIMRGRTGTHVAPVAIRSKTYSFG